MYKTTFVIPTHERADQIVWLISSLVVLPFSKEIIVVDSSRKVNNILKLTNGLHYFHLDSNPGISASRNLWLSHVDTENCIFMDDDFQLGSKTRLSEFISNFESISQDWLDLLGWWVKNIWTENFDFHGTYSFYKGILFHFIGNRNMQWRLEVIHNYFIAKTQKVLDISWWDEQLKFAREHDDFFLRARNAWVYVDYNPDYEINHIHWKKYYEEHEQNNKGQSVAVFCKKWEIDSKIEVRKISNPEGDYLSIVRFMWSNEKLLSDDELRFIYSQLWLNLNQIPFRYSHRI